MKENCNDIKQFSDLNGNSKHTFKMNFQSISSIKLRYEQYETDFNLHKNFRKNI